MGKFQEYQFRASQNHLLMGGTIGITEEQEKRITALVSERETGLNNNGNKCKWTENKIKELEKLDYNQKNPELPKTMQNELRKIHRSETFNRNFPFTNRYLQKGIDQEKEATGDLNDYIIQELGINCFLDTNTVRLFNKYFQGLPDINPLIFKGKNCGFDTKCSWSLDTFPYSGDALDAVYEYQNQTYMDLSGAEMWITAYVLVNCTEQGVFNEKNKHFYALGMPGDAEHKNWDALIVKYREVEKMLIFDYDRFIALNPYHQIEYTRTEWMNELNPVTGELGLDIPLKNRVVLKESFKNEKVLEEMRDRVKAARNYLVSLEEQTKI